MGDAGVSPHKARDMSILPANFRVHSLLRLVHLPWKEIRFLWIKKKKKLKTFLKSTFMFCFQVLHSFKFLWLMKI